MKNSEKKNAKTAKGSQPRLSPLPAGKLLILKGGTNVRMTIVQSAGGQF